MAGMRDWFAFDVGLSLTPVALVCLRSSLVGRWSGWAGPLRDGQLCFSSAALAATAIKDVIRLGRTADAPHMKLYGSTSIWSDTAPGSLTSASQRRR
jgi:hypothetical protein